MSKVFIVIDELSEWKPYLPSESVISFSQYMELEPSSHQRVRIINLCGDYGYLSQGYYCSLLAEARGQHVFPSTRVLNDLSSPHLMRLQASSLLASVEKSLKKRDKEQPLEITAYFGYCPEAEFQPLAKWVFEKFPAPILNIRFEFHGKWDITEISAKSAKELDDQGQTDFAESLDQFCKKVWRESKGKKSPKFDLAILVNPEEKLPPSDPVAIKKFIAAGKSLEMNVELITPDDYVRIPEFDALFIRETTAIDHHTYRFAKKAESEGLVVIDDPTSILRCTNKIYLAKLFETNKVPAPKTLLIERNKPDQLKLASESLGFPIVLKIPDGSFSRGMAKVSNMDELSDKSKELLSHSAIVLAQEFLYTEFDWRIGILNHKPIYACRYYMVKNHWQIYKHDGKGVASGKFDTMPTYEVPKYILQAAVKAAKSIGDGFYGVDVKEANGKGYVIEVNDNPSIDSAVEDKYLGNELYKLIMEEIVRRIEERRGL